MNYDLETISAGLNDPVLDSQILFRSLLHAMSRPGTIMMPGVMKTSGQSGSPDAPLAPPEPMSPATAAVLLTLADMDTPVWVPEALPSAVGTYLRFHCGCPMAETPERAVFALFPDGAHLPDLAGFSPGTQEYPDRSATLIVQVAGFEPGRGMRLSGPGIRDEVRVDVLGLDPAFRDAFRANHTRFPRGWDVIFTTTDELMCLPRTVKMEG